MKSLRQISEKYNVTKAGLYRRISKIPHFKQNYMHRAGKDRNREWLIEDQAVPMIAKPTHNVRPHHYKHATNTPPTKLEYQKKCQQLTKQNLELSKAIYSLSRSYQTLAHEVKHQPRIQKRQGGFAGLLKRFFK